ncbi:MAG: SPASM domain-containing protein, partial [Clostridiales bacterium]|nr:SPASM domain-containing protein [Clostridiales bacterium]
NVLDGSFHENIQKTFSKNHVLNKPSCQNCWAKFFCSGGCAANAQAYSGNLFTPNDIECQMERKRLEYAIALAVKEEKDRLSLV